MPTPLSGGQLAVNPSAPAQLGRNQESGWLNFTGSLSHNIKDAYSGGLFSLEAFPIALPFPLENSLSASPLP